MNEMRRLEGRVIGITGAAGGLGRATALRMAREGARLALTDRDAAGLAETARQAGALGARAVEHAGDVVDAATHAALVAAAIDAFGRLDGWCNVAGVLGPGRLEDLTRERFDAVMHVNCLAAALAIQQAAPAMREGGAIVNVASIGGLVSLPMMSVYCASKSALIGLTRALAAELAPRIRCNVVCPGGIDTPMSQALLGGLAGAERETLVGKLTGRQLIPRFAQPDEIAGTLAFLVSDDAVFMTGAVLAADGGHSSS